MSRDGRWITARLLAAGALALTCALACAREAGSPYLEELTWTEVRDRLGAGATTVLVPIGGTEQSGPYVALGKHNARARLLAGRIARRLGDALVAPTLAYVPEGQVEPPTGHMRFAGTISIPEATFESVLEATARSLRRHGFRTIVFLGDHGDYQRNLERVAAKLEREWRTAGERGAHAVALLDYYRTTQTEYVAALRAEGYGVDEIGTHAGLADTALTLALDPTLVRAEALVRAPKPGVAEGVHGDPRRATAALGQLGVDRIVERSVQKIREASR